MDGMDRMRTVTKRETHELPLIRCRTECCPGAVKYDITTYSDESISGSIYCEICGSSLGNAGYPLGNALAEWTEQYELFYVQVDSDGES